ncbi:MAG: DoxX family protein [Chitinophagaceae bacterium]|nr:DoxX family protein [Chitinophagaceae bacterium]
MKFNKPWIQWLLVVLLAIPFLISALMKLSGNEEVVKSAAAWGVASSKLMLIGIIELLCLVLFIIPRTGILGTLLLAAYLGGAIATHLEHSQSVIAPVIFETLVFIIACIRFPELTKRIIGSDKQ